MNHKIQFYLKKTLIFISLSVLILLVLGFLSFNFFIQKNLDEFKNKLTIEISQQFEKKVEIGSIEAHWRVTSPSITLNNLSIYNSTLKKSFNLKKVRIDISWLSLLKWKLVLDEIILYEPILDIEKLNINEYAIGGISIKTSKNSSAANWLLNQDEIIIINGKIRWTDRTRDAPTLIIEKISATYESAVNLSNLNRRNFNINGELLKLNNQKININGYFDSPSIEKIKDSAGQLRLSIAKVNINTFKPWVDYPAEIISAKGDIDIRVNFIDGKINQVDSQLDVRNFVTKMNESNEQTLTLKRFKGQISYMLKKDVKTFIVSKFNMATDNGIKVEQGEIAVSINTVEKKLNKISLKLNRINLQSAHDLIKHLPYTGYFQSMIQEVSPSGQLKDLKLEWKVSNNHSPELILKSQLLNISVNPYQNFPGIKNLTGVVDIKKSKGTVRSVSKDLTIIKNDIFRQPIMFSQFSGLIEWKDNLFNLKNIVIQNKDINSVINGSYKHKDAQSGIMDISIKIPSIDIYNLKKYYPLQLGEKTLHWLDTSLLKGQAKNTIIILKGNTQDFPFVDNENKADFDKGIFTIESTIAKSFIEYGAGWPELNSFDFKINVRNNDVKFQSIQGNILNNNIIKMIGNISPFNIEEPIMNIDLALDSPIPKIINAINKSPIRKVMKGFIDEMQGEGPGQLNVKLNIPLKDEDNITFNGSYEFKNSYLINDDLGMPKINNIFGYLKFDENNVTISDAKANLSGSPVSIGLNNIGDTTQVNIDGIINQEFVLSTLGNNWANKFVGEAHWKGEIKLGDKATSIKIESDLKGLEVNLPPPFNKKENDITTFLLESEPINSNQEMISLELGTYATARLIKENNHAGALSIKSGLINVNTVQTEIPDEGVLLSADLNKVNLELFNSLFNNLSSKPLITDANINIQELDIYGYKILNSNIKYLPSDKNSNIQILSDDVIGNILWNKTDNLLKAGFEKLHLKKTNALTSNKSNFIFLNPPKVNIKAKSLMLDEDNYGDLSLQAMKEDKVWNIQNFKINNTDHTISGTGLWIDEGLNPNTSINFTWNVYNIQKTFDQLSYPELIKNGEANVIGMLSWPNSPFDFNKASLKGNFSLTAKDGVVLEAKPGVARLFGLLTLQNLPRRLTLDFSDIFSKGFIFDRINAGVIVNNGILKTNRFSMEGPAAEVSIKGETNIIEETQNIHVIVNPRISDSLSLLSLAGGPLVGAAAFIAQKILKDPLNKIMSDEYQIIGTWDDPEEIETPRAERFGKMIEKEIIRPSSEFLNIK